MTDQMTASEETAILRRVRRELAEYKELNSRNYGISELTGRIEPLMNGIPFSDAISIFGCILIKDGIPYVMAEDIPENKMIWETPDELKLLGVWHEIGDKLERKKRHQDVHLQKSVFIKDDNGKFIFITPQDKRKGKIETKKDKRSDTMKNFAKLLLQLGYTPEILQKLWHQKEIDDNE